MLNIVKRYFSKVKEGSPDASGQETGHDIYVATCALLVEIARIDGTFSQEEMETVISILKEKYGLSLENIDALIAEAEKQLEESVDLWQFARLINENYSNEEKMEIIETLWRIVYVDGKMDQYEHYLMNKLKNLLRVSHNQLIDSKLKVKHSSQKRKKL
ncbi:MAG TPA: TerB family tellurite resistance protein [Desulfobacterales bacterium]|nr:TerB family tellurite resistance protein [Desulfobacterales bacterium]